MIPLSLFDYTEHNKIDIAVTRYINDNLADIVKVVLDTLDGDPEFTLDSFFPRDYLIREPEKCRNLISELYEMITSDVLRDLIKPMYEYLLYNILVWWQGCCEEDDPSQLIPLALKEDLKSQIIREPQYMGEDGENYLLQDLMDYEGYLDFCFYDHGFLYANSLVAIYLRNPDQMQKHFPYVNLDDYIDLMDCDLRELYLERQLTFQNNSATGIEGGIVYEFCNVLKRLQKRVVQFENKSEVEISDEICDMVARILKVKYDLVVSREARMGRAVVNLGETDLYIYKENEKVFEDYVIIENKFIDNFLQQYDQLLGYLNQYFKFGITISINKKYSLQDAKSKIESMIRSIDDKEFEIVSLEKSLCDNPCLMKSYHRTPEDRSRQMPIYHMIFQLFDAERKHIALRARKNRSSP